VNILELQLPHRVKILSATAGRDTSGGNTEAYSTTVADQVPCLISQGSGGRQARHDQDINAGRWTVTGANAGLVRTDVLFLVQTGPRAGRYMRPSGMSDHGGLPWLDQFYRATVEEVTS
jgi:hypothetical protein